jgi:hypothetical protein
MAFIIKDRVRESTTTTGTSAISLGGTSTSFQTFSSNMSNGDTTHYAIVHQTADEWEVGVGTWNTGNTLTRTTVLSSSNSNAAVSFTSGTKDVFMTYPATKSINKDTGKADIDALGINATQVSGFTIGKSVPSNAVFTDTNTTYSVGDGGLTQNNFTNADHTKLDGIEASADVTDTANVVAALTAGTNITIAANGTIASTASGGTSYTHPNHSGEVTSTGDGATVISSNVVDADNLKVTGNGSSTQFLRSDGDGTFTWATPVDTNTTYSIGDGGLTTNDFTNADHSKLNAIEAGATADQTNAEIRAAVEAASDSNVFTDADHTKLNGIATGATAYTNANAISAVTASDLDMGGNKVLFGNMYSTTGDLPSASTYHGMFAHVHATGKGYFAHNGAWVSLANASDIVTYTVQDGQLSQNNFTNADHSKLDAIESNATADQTASEIRTLVESATDSNVFTDADHTKLNAIEASADVTDTANVVAALTAGTNVSIAANGTISSTDTNTTYSIGDGGLTTNDFTNADHSKLDGIASSANNYTHPNHSGEVTSTADGATVIADNVVDEANLKVSNTPTDGYMLTAQSGNAGGLTWAAAASGGGGASSINGLSDGFADSNSNLGLGDNSAFGNISTAYRNIALGWNTAGSITTGDDNVLLGRNVSAFLTTGTGNTAVGSSALPGNNLDKMTGNYNTAVGQSSANSIRAGDSGTFIGHNSNGASNADFQTAIGYNAVTGAAGATALTNSRASGADSFAANIANNSTSYGASGANSIAIGYASKSTGMRSVSVGTQNTSSNTYSTSIGYLNTASGQYSTALGREALSATQSKFAYASGKFSSVGDAQSGMYVLRTATTDATATAISVDGSSINSANGLNIPNDSVYGFTGTVIAREDSSATNDFAVWEIKGGVVRAASANTTALGSYNINKISESTGASNWDIALSTNTTHGQLAITVTGEASHNIRWVATVNTTEVTY